MRVLHVTSTFPREDGDPTGPFLAQLCTAEHEAGVDVRVVAPHAPGLPLSQVIGGVRVRRFRYGPAASEVLAYRGGLLAAARSGSGAAMVPSYLAAMAAVAGSEARSWRADLVHAHWWFPGGVAVATATRRPFVVTLHGSDVGLARRPSMRRAARYVFGRAGAVVAVSDWLAAEAATVVGLPRGAVGVGPMPVIVSGKRPWPPPRRTGPVRLVAVGRLAAEKGFDVLIDAVGLASANGLVVELDVVGEGPEREALARRAADRGVADAVHFLGALSPVERDRRVVAASALVAPSRREGLGLAAVEAVLLGTPVIASHTGGLPGALGAPIGSTPALGSTRLVPGGVLVAPEDVAGLAAALSLARGLPAPSGAALVAAARHDPAAVAAQHIELYLGVLARS